MTPQAIIAAARSWLGTPFHPQGRVKGERGGCSCQTLVGEVYREAGIIPPDFKVPEGPMNWCHANRQSLIEPFMETLTFMRAVDFPVQDGDVLGFVMGGCVHHLGIADGTQFIHVMQSHGVHYSSMNDSTWLQRLKRVWRPVYEQV